MTKTVMIVDDSASMRQMVSFTLRDGGYDVITANNGTEAVSMLGGVKIDMVITDLNMPGIDGIELTKRLRTLPGSKFIPILMLTTESQDGKKTAGKQAGASGWIVKPFRPDQLIETVKRFLK